MFHRLKMDASHRSGRPSYSDSWVDQVTWIAGICSTFIITQVFLLLSVIFVFQSKNNFAYLTIFHRFLVVEGLKTISWVLG